MSEATQAPRAIVVLGMHRSGTSAVARCCGLLGGELGANLLAARPDNEAGFWEDAAVVALDDAALLGLRLVWSDIWPIDPASWQSAEVLRAREGLIEIARERLAAPRPWVVKDPRISRLLPMWLGVLDEVGAEPGFLIALRHPAEIADSLGRRDGLSRAHCDLLWLRYALESERHTRGRRRAFVRYPDLLSDWHGAMTQAGRDLGLEWPVASDAAAAEIDAFLRRDLRHHVADEAAFAADEGVAAWVRRAAIALERAAGGDVERGEAELDRIRAELESADAVVTRVARELEGRVFELRAAIDRPEQPIRAAREQAARLAIELAHERRGRAEAERAREESQRAYAEAVAQAAQTAERIGRLEAELALARETIGTQARREVELRDTLEAIFASRSWRLTAVLRGLARRGRTTPRAARA